nr:MAG TPA: hypothetical protein [Caudoviricetes sp.]
MYQHNILVPRNFSYHTYISNLHVYQISSVHKKCRTNRGRSLS